MSRQIYINLSDFYHLVLQNWVVLDVDIGTGMQKQDRSYKCQSKQKADHWVKGKVEKFLQLQNETLESIQPSA